MKDVCPALCALLEEEFHALLLKRDPINLESKIRTCRFLGELVKFRAAPPALLFACLKKCAPPSNTRRNKNRNPYEKHRNPHKNRRDPKTETSKPAEKTRHEIRTPTSFLLRGVYGANNASQPHQHQATQTAVDA